MKLRNCLVIALAALLSFSCTEPVVEEETSYDDFSNLVLNEVSPAKSFVKEAWIEIYNNSSKEVNLKGLRLNYINDSYEETVVVELQEGKIEANGYYVISSKEIEFAAPVLRAALEEISIIDRDNSSISSFSVTYDISSTDLPEDGECYARIPDATGKWAITNAPTPGAANYKVTYRDLSSLVFNEVCPSEGWVEIVSTAKKAQNIEYAYIADASGNKLYTFPADCNIETGGRMVAEIKDAALDNIVLYSNNAKQVASFSSKGLAEVPEGGSWSRIPDITGNFRTVAVATKGEANADTKTDLTGIVINEVSSKGGWVEISNSNLEAVSGVAAKLYGVTTSGEKEIYSFTSENMAPSAKRTAAVAVSSYTGLVLKSTTGDVLDSFQFSDVEDDWTATESTSWSRIPDSKGKWYTVKTPTEGENNYGITYDNNIAVWVNQSATNTVDLEELCRLGYGKIILHEWAFKNYGTARVQELMEQAHSLGQELHIWLQCFWWNDSDGWRCPVIDRDGDTPARYNQELFDDVISRAKGYVQAGVDGIHFDYIRFPGTAYKHDFTQDGITGKGAITEFCRQSSTALRAINPDIFISAAMMGETGAQSYYGQEPSEMTLYFDALLPMAYISSYGYGDSKNAAVADWFKNRANGKKVWHGISTYDSNSKALSAEDIYDDCKNIDENSKADGVALFRHGFDNLPDLNDLFR